MGTWDGKRRASGCRFSVSSLREDATATFLVKRQELVQTDWKSACQRAGKCSLETSKPIRVASPFAKATCGERNTVLWLCCHGPSRLYTPESDPVQRARGSEFTVTVALNGTLGHSNATATQPMQPEMCTKTRFSCISSMARSASFWRLQDTETSEGEKLSFRCQP